MEFLELIVTQVTQTIMNTLTDIVYYLSSPENLMEKINSVSIEGVIFFILSLWVLYFACTDTFNDSHS